MTREGRKEKKNPILEPEEDSAAVADSASPAPEAGAAETAPGSVVSLSREKYEELLAQAAEAEGNRDKMLRAMAELDNVRKRLEKEKTDSLVFSNQELIRELLPVMDNFQRALESSPEGGEDPYRAGVEMILKQLKETLARHGLEEVEALGKPFDPFLHEAVACVESAECPEGTVAEEILRGYLFKGRLLRPTAVRVFRSPPEVPES